MPERSTSVPQVPGPGRRRWAARAYRFQFPAPDDEPFDGVDQVEFAVQYFVYVVVMAVGVASFAAFVLVPLAGLVFAG